MYKVRNYDIKLVEDGSVTVNGKWQKVDESLHARTENGRTEYVYITRSDSICHLYHGKMPVEHLDWIPTCEILAEFLPSINK
ncbi:MAG: hypothetical protein J5824_03295 [Lachnospiraceae bacterium]|nr:hypothetical protein [Lachnospiraceae bacterium]